MPAELCSIAKTLTHYSLHLLAPGVIAWLFFRTRWKHAWLVMVLTMLVDLDHLFAWPDVYVAGRCSLGFHPLHTWPAIGGYAVLAALPRFRIIGIGLLFHMSTDLIDCLWRCA